MSTSESPESLVERQLIAALRSLPEAPIDSGSVTITGEDGRPKKKSYSELMSQVIAYTLAGELRRRGLEEVRPVGPGERGRSGAERRISGGIGAKKVDVTWATEESGLLLAISIKCINARDQATLNYQKNLTNRRGDLLFEAVTLHRRFPFAVLAGFMFLAKGADADHTERRSSTFRNAHRALRLFTGRPDPAAREEQFERLFLGLVEASPFGATAEIYAAGDHRERISLDRALDGLLRIVADREPDLYVLVDDKGRAEPDESVSPLYLARRVNSGQPALPQEVKRLIRARQRAERSALRASLEQQREGGQPTDGSASGPTDCDS